MTRTRESPFPIPVKILAHRTVISKLHEHVHFGAWADSKIVEALDAAERVSVRAFFGNINIPNTALIAENKASGWVWRQRVLFLAGLIRALGSKDRRTRVTTLPMTRDACLVTTEEI